MYNRSTPTHVYTHVYAHDDYSNGYVTVQTSARFLSNKMEHDDAYCATQSRTGHKDLRHDRNPGLPNHCRVPPKSPVTLHYYIPPFPSFPQVEINKHVS